MKNTLNGSLKGLRVIELTLAMSGPFCAQMLSDHGADVVKVEPPDGDFYRIYEPFSPDDAEHVFGGNFQSLNRNKRSVVLDLKHPDGREAFLRLVDGADVVVENFRVGVMDRLGLGYDVLAQRNPRLVYTSISGFGDPRNGQTVYSSWPAVDIVAQAFSGLMGMNGPENGDPTLVAGSPGDTVPGLCAAFATMIAVWEASRSGKGQYVDVAMVDTLLSVFGMSMLNYAYKGEVPGPVGHRNPLTAPFGRIKTKDGWAALAAPMDRAWNEFCDVSGQRELKTDPRFVNEAARIVNRDAVYEAVEAYTREHTTKELLEALGGRIPFAPINDAGMVFDDPYFEVRQMLPKLDHPGSARQISVLGVSAKLSRTPGGVHHRAPLLGEHTREVLLELGYTDDEIFARMSAGAIGGVGV